MPHPNQKIQISTASEKVLHACSATVEAKGLHSVLGPLSRIARQTELPTDRASRWIAELTKAADAVRSAYQDPNLSTDERRQLTGEPDQNASRTFQHLYQIAQVDPQLPGRSKLDQLLLLSIATTASAGARMSEALAWGFLQCLRALGGTSKQWRQLAENLPDSIDDIDTMLKGAPPTPAAAFLRSLREVLALEIAEVLEDTAEPSDAPCSSSETTSRQQPDGKQAQDNTTSPVQSAADQAETELEAHSPLSVRSRLHSAQFATWAARSGITLGWDHLPLAELQLLCPALNADLSAPEPASSFAALALCSLLSATQPRYALHLSLSDPANDDLPWLDLTTGCFNWSHAACTGRATEGPAIPLNAVWWPEPLVAHLRQRAAQCPDARELLDLLGSHIRDKDGDVDLTEFHGYLRSNGDLAHKAEPARFSRSLPQTLLDLTGSECFAAWCCMRFDCVAPSALSYFSPANGWLHQQLTSCYAQLGLGQPVQMQVAPEGRQGARALPTSLQILRTCFARIEQCLVDDLKVIHASRDQHATVEAFNRLGQSVHAAIVFLFGGRGTKPERMTTTALTSSRLMFTMREKETEVSSGWRLLPHTGLSLALIDLYQHARERMDFRLNLKGNIAKSDSFFTHIDPASRKVTAMTVTTATNKLIATFDVPFNIARHSWLTTLHEQGADRWLIRALSGHGSQRTSAFSEEMSVAPSAAMGALRAELERLTPQLIGDGHLIQQQYKRTFRIKQPSTHDDASVLLVGSKSANTDANGWIDTITTRCLVDHAIVERARHQLIASPPTDPSALLLLSSLMIDGVPQAKIAIELATSKLTLMRIDSVAGCMWPRPHYIHDTFITAQPPTVIASAQIKDEQGDTRRVLRDASSWLRRIDRLLDWPEDDKSCVDRLASACAAWRRIQLPPTLSALSSTGRQAPTVSINSLLRLAGKTSDMSPLAFQPVDLSRAPHILSRKNHDLEQLSKSINKWAESGRPLGGQVARAQSLKAELGKLPTGTEVHEFCKRFVVHECEQIIATQKGKLSSLSTRWTALHPTLSDLPPGSDIVEFNESQWTELVEKVVRWCATIPASSSPEPASPATEPASHRAADALQRFLRAALTFGCGVTQEVWSGICREESCPPRSSASSTVLTTVDKLELIKQISSSLREHPQQASRGEAKVTIQLDAPVRGVEVSSSPIDCLTRTGTLIVPKTAFSSIKTRHSVRQIAVSASTLAAVTALTEATRRQSPNAKYVFRFDQESIIQDTLIDQVINQSIKYVTRDPSAVAYAMRGNAYMQRLWPDWLAAAMALMQGQLSSAQASLWIASTPQRQRWTLAIEAGIAAGHGAVEPAFNHYAAAWPLVYAIHMRASLAALPQPGQSWIDMVGLTNEALRKARFRSNNSDFDSWSWLASKIDQTSFPSLMKVQLQEIVNQPPTDTHPPQKIGRPLAMQYLVLRMLQLRPERAAHICGMAAQDQPSLEEVLPPTAMVEHHRARINGGSQGRALDGDIKAAQSQEGLDLIEWMSYMPPHAFDWLYALLISAEHMLPGPIDLVRKPETWQMLCTDLPAAFGLRLWFGPVAHLTIAEEAKLASEVPRIKLANRAPDRGPLPRVAVWRSSHRNSTVDMARLTSVVRLSALARQSIAATRWAAHPSGARP